MYCIRSCRLTDLALGCAPPVYPEDTPAGGRRSCRPTGRPPAGSPGKPRGGGAAAGAPCWAARLSSPGAPITGAATYVSDGDDEHAIRLSAIDETVWESGHQTRRSRDPKGPP